MTVNVPKLGVSWLADFANWSTKSYIFLIWLANIVLTYSSWQTFNFHVQWVHNKYSELNFLGNYQQ